MSCPGEIVWMAYVHGELEASEMRPVETHLIGCERCRGLVLALQEEDRLLADVLHERRRQPMAVAAEAPARGVARGLPVAVAMAAAVVAGLGTLLETRLPSGAGWLSPTRLLGVNEMLFDVVFTVREQAPGLFDLALAVAATFSGAALITFLATTLLRRVDGGAVAGSIALLVLVLAPAVPARAALEFRGGDDEVVQLAEGEVVDGTLVAHGQSVRIDGAVHGNLVVFADELDVRGSVEGSVFAFVRAMDVSGEVSGTVITGSEDVRVEGLVGGNLLALGDRVTLAEEGHVEGDLATIGQRVQVIGRVSRDWVGLVERGELRGDIGRDVELFSEEASIEASARIGGGLRAHVMDEADLRVDPEASIDGETEILLVDHEHMGGWSRYASLGFWLMVLARMVAALAVGLLVHAVFPRLFRAEMPSGGDFLLAVGKGFVLLLVAPAVIVCLALTLVGIPVALILAAVFLCAVYLSGIAVAVLIGRHLVRPETEELRDFGLALLAGIAILAVAFILPGLGGILRVVILLGGLGILLERAVALWRESRPGRAAA